MSYLLRIGGIVFVLDQVTKVLIVYYLPLYSVLNIIPGFFNLVHVQNTGAAFSFLAGDFSVGRHIFFIVVNLIGIGVVIYLCKNLRQEQKWARFALALIFGGALGNLFDRLHQGRVTDFLDFYIGRYHWPAFNIADSAISVGAVILLLSFFKTENPPK